MGQSTSPKSQIAPKGKREELETLTPTQIAPMTRLMVDIREFVPQLMAELPGDCLFIAILAQVIAQVALYSWMA